MVKLDKAEDLQNINIEFLEDLNRVDRIKYFNKLLSLNLDMDENLKMIKINKNPNTEKLVPTFYYGIFYLFNYFKSRERYLVDKPILPRNPEFFSVEYLIHVIVDHIEKMGTSTLMNLASISHGSIDDIIRFNMEQPQLKIKMTNLRDVIKGNIFSRISGGRFGEGSEAGPLLFLLFNKLNYSQLWTLINLRESETDKRLFDPNTKNNKISLLVKAISDEERFKTVDVLLQNGADPNYRFGENNITALHYLIIHFNEFSSFHIDRVFNILIKYSAVSSIQDKLGNTPLHYAAEGLNESMVKKLLDVDVNVQNKNGNTPLHFAISEHKDFESVLNIVGLLIKSGADHTIKNNKGNTPLELFRIENELFIK